MNVTDVSLETSCASYNLVWHKLACPSCQKMTKLCCIAGIPESCDMGHRLCIHLTSLLHCRGATEEHGSFISLLRIYVCTFLSLTSSHRPTT